MSKVNMLLGGMTGSHACNKRFTDLSEYSCPAWYPLLRWSNQKSPYIQSDIFQDVRKLYLGYDWIFARIRITT